MRFMFKIMSIVYSGPFKNTLNIHPHKTVSQFYHSVSFLSLFMLNIWTKIST